MAEYISREAFKAEVRRLSTHYLNEWDTLGVLAAAERIPAADVRPVVLCKDCEYYQADCGWCGLLDIGMNVNGFCSRGIKKEEI